MSTLKLNGIEAIEYEVDLIRAYDSGYYVKIRGNYVEIGNKNRISVTMDGPASYQNALMYLCGLLEGLMKVNK
jgi:hypothetical protein